MSENVLPFKKTSKNEKADPDCSWKPVPRFDIKECGFDLCFFMCPAAKGEGLRFAYRRYMKASESMHPIELLLTNKNPDEMVWDLVVGMTLNRRWHFRILDYVMSRGNWNKSVEIAINRFRRQVEKQLLEAKNEAEESCRLIDSIAEAK